MENLEGVQSKCMNMSGYSRIWGAFENEVHSIGIVDRIKKSVLFSEQKSWGEIVGARNIYLVDNEDNGLHNIEVRCNVNMAPDQIDGILSGWTRSRFVLKLKDKNGKLWLVGSKRLPLRFSYTHTGEPKGNGVHHYELRWFVSSNDPVCGLFEE